jgi:hypothetical protein
MAPLKRGALMRKTRASGQIKPWFVMTDKEGVQGWISILGNAGIRSHLCQCAWLFFVIDQTLTNPCFTASFHGSGVSSAFRVYFFLIASGKHLNIVEFPNRPYRHCIDFMCLLINPWCMWNPRKNRYFSCLCLGNEFPPGLSMIECFTWLETCQLQSAGRRRLVMWVLLHRHWVKIL